MRRRLPSLIAIAGLALAVIAIPTSARADDECQLTGASLHWGFKSSFRDYIRGPVANGDWMTDGGATFSNNQFRWRSGTGHVDPDDSSGLVGFVGSVTFSGHAGARSIALSNPELLLVDASHAYLLMDVDSHQTDGTVQTAAGVRFASLDLASGLPDIESPGSSGMSSVPTTLTQAGADAFGHYAAGETLDPLSYQLRYSAACEAGDPATTVKPAVNIGALGWLVFGLGLVAILALLGLVLFRRRAR